MPITKIPIVHKFGIISHSQRLELQERLLKQSYLNTLEAKKQESAGRNPYEVTEGFVQQYNNASSLDDQERLETVAYKMLERIKRRADLKGAGQGEHVDLPVAWTELAQLAQCKGKVQEDCLDVLITSLDQAPVEKTHIPALFYLAETCLYWLRTEAIHQPYLRTGEIKLLRMGQLVFTRLFYHHMAGQLQGHEEFKNRLFTYLDGFSESQEAYSPYPNALLCLRYISEVGKMVIGDNNTEAGEVKEGDNVTTTSVKTSEKADTESTSDSGTPESASCFSSRHNPRQLVVQSLFHEVSANYEPGTSHSSHSGAISSSVHDLSPTLWHALDVWRCVRQNGGGITQALHSLAKCAQGLAAESWIDGMCAMYILGDASRAHMQTLRVLQGLARGTKPVAPSGNTTSGRPTGTKREDDTPGDPSQLATHSHKAGGPLSDIFEKSEEYVSTRGQQLSSHLTSSVGGPAMTTPGSRLTSKHSSKRESTSQEIGSPVKAVEGMSHVLEEATVTDDGMNSASMLQHNGQDSDFQTDKIVEASTDLPTGRASHASSVPTYTNAVHPESPGLHGWHWEVATTYADMLADICLHGSTSNIQKVALMGKNKDVNTLHQQTQQQVPMPSAGLLDLVFFKSNHEEFNRGRNDWSWRVRYSAIQGLVKLCRCCAGDANKEGLRTVAWNILLRAHSLERDTRVLEALKVGQVDANIEKLLSQHLTVAPCSLGGKLAAGLAALYLPPLPPAVGKLYTKRPPGKKIVTTHPIPRKPLRTTLKDEILLATALYEPPASYGTRNTFDLHRVVEDQWRKQLHIEMEEEEEERQKELEKQQKEEEEHQRKLDEQRKMKLGKKYQGPAYDIQSFLKSGETSIQGSSSRTISPT